MATAHRRKAGPRRAAATPPEPATPDRTIDGALDRWSQSTMRELTAWGIGASATLLRGIEAMQQAQLDAARETHRLHEQAVEQLAAVHDAAELARIPFTLAQSDGQVALASLSRLSEAASRQAMDTWREAANGWAQLNGAAWKASLQWFDGVAHQSADPEIVEAEVEHVVSPLAASPFVWPAQEAARQAATLAGAAWNDWLAWSSRWAEDAPRA